MTEPRLNRRNAPVLVALVLVLVFAVFAVIMVLQFSTQPQGLGTPEAPSAESYRARVDALLAMAHPENVDAVFAKYACHACHQSGGQIAPSFEGVAERAAERRPPLPADAYLYESIVFPAAFVVEGYNDVMPPDFGARMTDQELADVLAYLLTPDAR